MSELRFWIISCKLDEIKPFIFLFSEFRNIDVHVMNTCLGKNNIIIYFIDCNYCFSMRIKLFYV